jgi:membrane fusion protein, multidrug efflux system
MPGSKRMSKFWWVAAIIVSSGAIAFQVLGHREESAAISTTTPQRRVQVVTDVAVKKKSPMSIESLGNVTTFANVSIKPRIDNEIVGVHFTDGAEVKAGDLLITLDTRALEAQLQQAEATLARDKAQLDGAERDVRRYSDLVLRGATPQLNLDNAATQSDTFRAAIRADEAAIKALRIQLSYCEIRAPISGRISQAAVKIGNFVRAADVIPIATINQMQPVYVTFLVPQQDLPLIRAAMDDGTASVEAMVEREAVSSHGQISMIENAIDATTGLATIRATMPNEDELLWPGAIVTARVTLKIEDAVIVPTTAVQVSPTGTYVYVVEDAVAVIRPVEVSRSTADEMVIRSGLSGGEAVVTDGHLLLSDQTPVRIADQ